MSRHYVVTWKIDIEADSPEAAAREALRIQRNPESIATVFQVDERVGGAVVKPHTIDLLEGSA
jgi:hypothetical protein